MRAPSKVSLGVLGMWLVLFTVVSYFALPPLSLIFKVSMGDFLTSLTSPVVASSIALSLMTSTASLAIALLFGTPVAYMLSRWDFVGKGALESVLDLPLVIPPVVSGIALLMTFGRLGLLGSHLYAHGVSIAFTTLAVVMAQTFVSAPFYIKSAKTGFSAVDKNLEQAARTLGARGYRTFFAITLPLSLPSVLTGALMSWARALGEFGATIMFAGNFMGKTQTMPLAIYSSLQSSLDGALTIAVVLMAISFSILMTVRMVAGGMKVA
ncbi:MAG: ABC transporter permease [Methermicoccaceae archaeon]